MEMDLTFDDLPKAMSELLAKVNRIEKKVFDERVSVSDVEEDETMNTTQLAKYLKCTPMTIYNYIKRDAIPYFKVGNKKYFKKSEIDKALKVR